MMAAGRIIIIAELRSQQSQGCSESESTAPSGIESVVGVQRSAPVH